MKQRGIPGHHQQQQPTAQEHLDHMPHQQPQTVVGQPTKTMISTDKNLMPSMVARLQQQQQQQSGSANNNNNNHNQQPEVCWPPKGLDNLTKAESNNTGQQRQMFDQDGLVLPRRVLRQPPISVSGQQPTTIRDLNRELKFNQIQGKNVLDNKSELKKALEKLEASKRRKEAEQERLNRRTSLELRLEERAERIARESGASSASSSGEAAITTTTTTTTTGLNNNSTSGQHMGNNVVQ